MYSELEAFKQWNCHIILFDAQNVLVQNFAIFINVLTC